MTTEKPVTGGCACGAIRYQFSGAPIAALNCHCRECQYASGGAFAPVIILWKETFTLSSGNPTYYSIDAENPFYLHRGFCPSCGSPIILHRPERPKLVFVLAGSLDNPDLYKPTMNIFTDEAHKWDKMDNALENFSGMFPVPDGLGQ